MPAITCEALVSNERESVPFKMTKKLTLKGKVENYLNELIDSMRFECRAQIGEAIRAYDITRNKRPEWLKYHTAQLALAVTMQQWTLKTDEALRAMTAGNAGVLNEYYQFQLKMISDMIDELEAMEG